MNMNAFCVAVVSLWCCQQALSQVEMPDSATGPVKIIGREAITRMGASNLAEVLRYELNIEIEQAPATGGARTRTFDLNSRYLKILIDGIPIAGSDLFGGHIDVSSIAVHNVEAIEITHDPMGLEYGGGSLTGTVNIRIANHTDQKPSSVRASVHEESVGNEYNVQTGNRAKGRHIQQLGISQRLSNRLAMGANASRDVFTGHWDTLTGKQYADKLTYTRGYTWSPRTTWNVDGFISYQANNFTTRYHYALFRSELISYARTNGQEFSGDVPLPLFTSLDHRYVHSRGVHHVQVSGKLWHNADYSFDASVQNGDTKRQIRSVNTATNNLMADSPLTELYATRTFYARGKLSKPLAHGRLVWLTGFEFDGTNGKIAAAPGTYVSRAIDRDVVMVAGFTAVTWNPLDRLAFRPGIRIAHSGISGAFASPSLALHYGVNDRSKFSILAERVNRFPYHRELFTYLENEFNLLEGNTDLKPETGHAVLLTWRHRFRDSDALRIKTDIQSGFRQLKDRIAIEAIPTDVPTQDHFSYSNLREHRSWTNSAVVCINLPSLQLEAAASLIGQRGDDVADVDQYDRYLFHIQTKINATYSFTSGYWLQVNYKHVGSQPIYSFERELPNPEMLRVHNQSPAFNMLDVNIGTTIFRKHLELSGGIRNVFDIKSITFDATDGQPHYRGDLRTQYIGYGRGFYLRMVYRL